MKITAPVTDYIRASIMTVQGDLVTRGAAAPERLGVGVWGRVLQLTGAGPIPAWAPFRELLIDNGDIWIKSAGTLGKIAAGALNTYFKGQGAANLPIYEKLALRDTGVKIGSSFRSTGGTQVITGVGFIPSLVIFLAVDFTTTAQNWSIGFSEGVENMCIERYLNGTKVIRNTGRCIDIDKDVGNIIYAVLASMDADGFTLTWTLTGTVQANFIYLCLP
ncbi:MAG: hypothetical protein FVQ79_12180 [Planctomycetes bacterium]|nr:hypothetical protein [Planctomycetota bacterium]